MAWIKKRGPKYEVGWRNLAGEERTRTCPTRANAKNLKLEVEGTLSEGRDWQPEITGREPLLREVAEAYIEKRALKKRADTVRMDGVYLDVFVRFCATKEKRATVALLSRPLLDSYLAWLARPYTTVRKKKPRKGVTIAKFIRAAQLMWVWAENCERWPGMIPRPRLLAKDDIPDSAPQPVVAPTWAEMDACVHACRGWQRKLATWLRYTGLRVNESMQFMRADVDTDRGELTIRPEIDKSGVGRIIPLSKLILDEIETWAKRDVGAEREGYLIPSNRRPGPHEREPRSRDMALAWKAAGVREAVWKRRPDHAFRKGFKSELLAAKADRDAVDYLQGHKLGAGSRGLYIDPTRLPTREALALIPAITAPTTNVTALPGADKVRTTKKRGAAK